MIDRKAWQDKLWALGEDPDRDGLARTADRFEKAMDEMLSGYREDPKSIIQSALFYEEHAQSVPITVRDIRFWSLCEHHLMPFFGKVSVTYTPADKYVIGLSKIPRAVNAIAYRLQTQEGLTAEIAESIRDTGVAQDVQVMIEANHTCMEARGVHAHGAETITSIQLVGECCE